MLMKMLIIGATSLTIYALDLYVHHIVDKKNQQLAQEVARLQLENLLIKKELEEIERAVKPTVEMQRKMDGLLQEFNQKYTRR